MSFSCEMFGLLRGHSYAWHTDVLTSTMVLRNLRGHKEQNERHRETKFEKECRGGAP